jgi:hypothetical protein
VNLENGLIYIFDPKGVDTRQAYMTAQIRQALEDIRPEQPGNDDLVFRLAPAGNSSTFQALFTVW